MALFKDVELIEDLVSFDDVDDASDILSFQHIYNV